MKKIVFTVAVLSLLFTLMVISPHRVESRPQSHKLLTSTPAPVMAGGGVAAVMGLVGAPIDLVFALRGGGTTDFWQYSISQNAWTTLPETPAPVGDGGGLVQICSHNSCAPGANRFGLAALRGDNSTDFWIFDIKENSWCARPGTPATVGAGGAIAQLQGSGEIYALRGGGTTSFWKFNKNGIWTELANTPGPVNTGSGLVGINYGTQSQKAVLYALQGGGSTAIWKYDVDTNTWTHQTDTPTPIDFGGGITSPNFGAEGTLVVLQGGGSAAVWSLDVAENTWRSLNGPSDSVDFVAAGGAISHQFNGCNFVLAGGGSKQFFSTGLRECVVIKTEPDFSLNFTQPTVTTSPFTKIKVQLNIIRTEGFIGKIILKSTSEKVPGIVMPEELELPESDSVTFKIKIKGGAQRGTYPITFAGTDTTGKVRNAILTLVIQ